MRKESECFRGRRRHGLAALLTAAVVVLSLPIAWRGAVAAAAPKKKGEQKETDPRFIPKGPNLVPNGDFSKGTTYPEHWEPLPPNVEWGDDKEYPEHGKVIHFKVPREVARTTGLKYWCDYIEVKPNQSYTMSFDCRKTGGVSLKVFIRGYGEYKGSRRMIYDTPVSVYGDGPEWIRYGRSKPFTTAVPGGMKVQWIRFMLYAYGGGEGEAWWDNVHMEEVSSAPEKDL